MISIYLYSVFSLTFAQTSEICGFANESVPTVLTCPRNQIITGFQYGIFGTFSSDSSCLTKIISLPAWQRNINFDFMRIIQQFRIGDNSPELDKFLEYYIKVSEEKFMSSNFKNCTNNTPENFSYAKSFGKSIYLKEL